MEGPRAAPVPGHLRRPQSPPGGGSCTQPRRGAGPKRPPLTVGPLAGAAEADTVPATSQRFTGTHLDTEREQTRALRTQPPSPWTTTPIAPRGVLHPSLRTPPRRVAGLARFPFPARLALVPAAAAEPCASAILSVCGGGGGGSGRASKVEGQALSYGLW
ncbi:unnamed protein product [Coccothraustes coccothraustes]